jgi:DNA-binding transcriptional ArsR family regulator
MDLKSLEQKSEKVAALLKSIGNEKRLMIVCILSNGEKNVGELEQMVGLSQSALSQHLARLRRDEILSTRREAQTIYYSIKDKNVLALLQCLHDICDNTPN